MVIKKLLSQADIELSMVLCTDDPKGKTTLYSSLDYPRTKSPSLWNLFYRHRVNKKSKALQEVNTSVLLNTVPHLKCNLILDENKSAKVDDATLAKLEGANLDFILSFSVSDLTGDIINAAKHGVWYFQFGDPEKYKGRTSCFWEIYRKDPVTRCCLMQLTDQKDRMIILKDGFLKTGILLSRNIDKIHFECTSWPLQVCKDIRKKRTESLAIGSEISNTHITILPSNSEILHFFFIQLELFLKKIKKSLFYTDFWNIGLAHIPIEKFLKSENQPEITWLNNQERDRFKADPFGINYKGELFIVYEDFRFDQGLGKIASYRYLNDDFIENEIVIDENFHMSYPFLVEFESEIYCIPETYQQNNVCLYRAEDFPRTWKLEKVLIDGYAGIDNTLYKEKDSWYLFSTDKYQGHHYNLNIHYSDSIFGPWEAHPKNPVKTDIRSARPAGTMFFHKGSIFRPSMDYSEKVEGRIVINKILKLTRTEFAEQPHTIVNPFESTLYADKVHTLSQIGSLTLVDGAKELFVFSNLKVLIYHIHKLLGKLKLR